MSPALVKLRDLVAERHLTKLDAERIAGDAQLSLKDIDFDGTSAERWTAVFAYAGSPDRLARLLEVLKKEHEDDAELQAAIGAVRGETPPKPPPPPNRWKTAVVVGLALLTLGAVAHWQWKPKVDVHLTIDVHFSMLTIDPTRPTFTFTVHFQHAGRKCPIESAQVTVRWRTNEVLGVRAIDKDCVATFGGLPVESHYGQRATVALEPNPPMPFRLKKPNETLTLSATPALVEICNPAAKVCHSPLSGAPFDCGCL